MVVRGAYMLCAQVHWSAQILAYLARLQSQVTNCDEWLARWMLWCLRAVLT